MMGDDGDQFDLRQIEQLRFERLSFSLKRLRHNVAVQ